MRTRITVDVARNDLPRISASFMGNVAELINSTVDAAHEAADPLTPRDLGYLAGNVVKSTASEGNLEGEIHWTQEYAAYQNDGFTHWKSGEHVAGTHYADEGAKAGERYMQANADGVIP